jgi:hypothetical protein
MKSSKSLTLDRSILNYLERACSCRSRNARVNELLWRAVLEEHYEALERAAAVALNRPAPAKALPPNQPRAK